MIAKFKNFCKKPITWGAYFKSVGVYSVMVILAVIGYVIYYNLTLQSLHKQSCESQTSDEN